ncbi:MAG: DUF5995 family protein [bacterium]
MNQVNIQAEVSPATTIDQVVEELSSIIEQSLGQNSRLGYFPALYRKVTVRAKEGIAAGRFEDAERMQQLDVVFANRYLLALQQLQNGLRPSKSWRVAFEASDSWHLLILQHLLLGMNAHINLDLGIAAAQTSPGEKLPGLERDFGEINKILSELLDEVQAEIGTLSPWLGLLDRLAGRTDEAVVNFSMQRARDAAWNVAERLAFLSPEAREAEIARLDGEVAKLARFVRNPGKILQIITFLIKIRESNDVAKNIAFLS